MFNQQITSKQPKFTKRFFVAATSLLLLLQKPLARVFPNQSHYRIALPLAVNPVHHQRGWRPNEHTQCTE